MGFWINVNNGYSPGPRHYCDLPPTRSTPTSAENGDWLEFFESAGPTLCGKRLQDRGYCRPGVSLPGSEYGGLSAVPVVNLLQTNLCGPCVRAYLETRPALAAAVEAAKRIRIDSV